MKNITIGLLIVLSSCLLGCNASITRSGYNINDLQANLSPCPDIIIKHKAFISQDLATILGQIEASDTGFSTACSEEYVLDIFRKDACALGANIINIIEETHPNVWSSCYRAKADLMRYKDKNMMIDIKSDSQYSTELVKERSKKTAILNTAGIIGGVVGGAIGAAIVGAAVTPEDSTAQNNLEWRFPIPADMEESSEWRKKTEDLYLTAKADFNGDGEDEIASLMINDKENKIGLFVTLTSEKDAPPVLLEEIQEKQSIKSIGVQVVVPGNYKTACGKGYWECKTDEPSEIEIKHPAIDLFQPEGANSFFVWNSKENNFKRIWMSD